MWTGVWGVCANKKTRRLWWGSGGFGSRWEEQLYLPQGAERSFYPPLSPSSSLLSSSPCVSFLTCFPAFSLRATIQERQRHTERERGRSAERDNFTVMSLVVSTGLLFSLLNTPSPPPPPPPSSSLLDFSSSHLSSPLLPSSFSPLPSLLLSSILPHARTHWTGRRGLRLIRRKQKQPSPLPPPHHHSFVCSSSNLLYLCL